MNDEFYVGYLDAAPPRLGRRLRWIVGLLAGAVVVLAGGLAARQSPAEPGVFEYGMEREFEGVLHTAPLPVLGVADTNGAVRSRLLVGAGKHGLGPISPGLEGHRVRVRGTRIAAGEAEMIEVANPSAVVDLGTATPDPAPVVDLGAVVLTGELVDTKCYFGVMRPATGKVHRACAVRCLSGGVPPGLLLRDGAGNGVVVLLTGPGGRPLEFDVRWAGRLVRVAGTLEIADGLARLGARSLVLAD